MIFAPKKAAFILVIQLLFVIVNEVNCAPLPDGNIFTRAWHAVKHIFSNLLSSAKSSIKHSIEKVNPIKSANCFSISRFFNKSFDILFTDETTASGLKFYFASPLQPNYTTVTVWNDSFSLKNIDFDPCRQTIVISHGFMSNGKEEWIRNMTTAFLKWDDVNVIVVDWEEGSNVWNYVGAALSTQIVGDELAKLFSHIRDEIVPEKLTCDQPGKLHFVGHSLGAHIVARAANKIKEDQNNSEDSKSIFHEKPWVADRITGLDPAQPCFISAKKHERLDVSDAKFVDVIHTNARALMLMGLGLPEQIGYIDFYPNGGQMQPGCPVHDESIWSYLLAPSNLIKATICSHGRAYMFFTDSIFRAIDGNCTYISHPWDRQYDDDTINKLMAKRCPDDNCPQLGINSIAGFPGNNGTYFTPAGHEEPYCLVNERDDKFITKQLKRDRSLKKMVKILGK